MDVVKNHITNLKEESHKEYLLYLVLNILTARLGNSVADIFLHSCTLSPRKKNMCFPTDINAQSSPSLCYVVVMDFQQ